MIAFAMIFIGTPDCRGVQDQAELADAGHALFETLTSSSIRAEVVDQENARLPGMDCYFSYSAKFGMRFTSYLLSHRKMEGGVLKSLKSADWLLNNDGKWICATSDSAGEADEKLKLRFLAGGFDWRSRKSAPVSRHMLPMAGLVWERKLVASLFDQEFWSQLSGHDDDTTRLVYQPEASPVQIEFRFEKSDGKFFLAGYTVLLLEAQKEEKKSLDGLIFEQVDFDYGSDKSKPDGYAYTYEYRYKGQTQHKNMAIRLTLRDSREPEFWRFAKTDVPNGTNVTVAEDRWSKFIYKDGEFYKLIDEKAIEEIQELYYAAGGEAQPSTPVLSARLPSGGEVKCLLSPYLGDRQSMPHCGMYSLAVAGAANGKLLPLTELLNDPSLSSQFGSSAESLIRFARSRGLHADLFQAISVDSLKEFDCPVLLHLEGSAKAEGVDHWMVYLGVDEDGNCRVMDVPRAPETITFAELLTFWDGTVIPVSDKPFKRPTRHYFYFSVMFVLTVAVTWGLSWIAKSSMAAGFAVLLLVGVLLATVSQFVSSTSYFRNDNAVAISKLKALSLSDDFEVTLENQPEDSSALWVDCRYPTDYGRSHVKGAVNFPVDATLLELKDALPKVFDQPKIICYCRNERCGWAKIIAAKLTRLGIKNVTVFEPGFDQLRIQPEMELATAVQ